MVTDVWHRGPKKVRNLGLVEPHLALTIMAHPYILKHHPPSPEDCKSDKALPRGEGLGGGNVDQYIEASSVKRMMLQYITLPSGTVNMSVDFRSKNALVPEHLLHSPQISPILNKMRGE